jgi:hypothetical protein
VEEAILDNLINSTENNICNTQQGDIHKAKHSHCRHPVSAARKVKNKRYKERIEPIVGDEKTIICFLTRGARRRCGANVIAAIDTGESSGSHLPVKTRRI